MLSAATTITAETTARHRRKYESQNLVQRWVMRRFHGAIWRWLDQLRPRRVLDFGCGEGYFWEALAGFGPLPEVVGLDLRADAIAAAQARLPQLTFVCEDVFRFGDAGSDVPRSTALGDTLTMEPGAFDLVIASQVLEHLYRPDLYLRRLCEFAPRHVLLTVPHEPFFRLANLLRGRDVLRWGNHPEHVQHWSRRGFARFVSEFIEIEKIDACFPFLMVQGTPKSGGGTNRW